MLRTRRIASRAKPGGARMVAYLLDKPFATFEPETIFAPDEV